GRFAPTGQMPATDQITAGQGSSSPAQIAPASQAPAAAAQLAPAGQLASATDGSPGTATTYIVERGDTLSGLSNRYGIPLATLAAANGISRLDLLPIGRQLLIPSQTTAQVATFAMTAAPRALAASTPVLAPLALATSTPLPLTGTTTTGAGTGSSTGTSVSALLASAAQAYGIDPALVKAVAWQESGWQMVVARDGGIGVMQLMPATAAWVGPALLGRTIDPYNLQDNINAGVALLASYLRQYGGNVQSALAAYNEGPLNLQNGILSSTAQYIANVLSLRVRFAQ
ncbi:MAG TPA: transglycosylase SLT domain-containing protein, partial [Chloroflexota bacterium]|nr:transglycosylase SLT domain-containing protein [Chloroflexota bacterium]